MSEVGLLRIMPLLQDVIDDFQSKGRYSFTIGEICSDIGCTRSAAQRALHRLRQKRRVQLVRKGFYVIIPVEYRTSGTMGPRTFIDSLMLHLSLPYYVGLLSAAEVHGSSHQKPMSLQVITDRQTKPINKESFSIEFYTKSKFLFENLSESLTKTGSFKLSSPEQTAIDLILFPTDSGGLNNVATVIEGLAEIIDGTRLREAAKNDPSISTAHLQRLGYLLDILGKEDIATHLFKLVEKQNLQVTPLRPDLRWTNSERSNRWKVAANEEVDPE